MKTSTKKNEADIQDVQQSWLNKRDQSGFIIWPKQNLFLRYQVGDIPNGQKR